MTEKKDILEMIRERKQKRNPNSYTKVTVEKNKRKPAKIKIYKHVKNK
ncbi:hypothetical protein RI065_00075 [Mycoplasmatota bacterium zrk1]